MTDETLNLEPLATVETPVVADPAVADTPPPAGTVTESEKPEAAGGSDQGETVTVQTAAGPQVVYVGPRLPAKPYPVAPKTIFRGDLPKPLAKAVKADADLAALFVPVEEFGAALVSLRNPATALSRSAAAVTAKYASRKEG